MPERLERLEEERSGLIKQLASLGDFRAGSVSAFTRRCGKPGCCCSRKSHPGHGPTLRLTYKLKGKTVTESLADQASINKARSEIAEFRRFQELTRRLVKVNFEICRLRSASAQQEERQRSKKNSRSQSTRKSGVR